VIRALMTVEIWRGLKVVLAVLLPLGLLLGFAAYARRKALEQGYALHYGRPNRETVRKGAGIAAAGGPLIFLFQLLVMREPLVMAALLAAVFCLGGVLTAFHHVERRGG